MLRNVYVISVTILDFKNIHLKQNYKKYFEKRHFCFLTRIPVAEITRENFIIALTISKSV